MLSRLIKAIFIFPIRVYQWGISPLLPSACRYNPTCSRYAVEAIEEWGVWKGWILAIKRIMRCHPWGGHGYDPVPKKSNKTEGDVEN